MPSSNEKLRIRKYGIKMAKKNGPTDKIQFFRFMKDDVHIRTS